MIWKEIPGYPDYMIREDGLVCNVKHERCIETRTGHGGYLRLNLYNNEGMKTWHIHKLVAMAFHGHIPNGHTDVIDHFPDENVLNNHYTNLRITDNRTNLSRRGGQSKYPGVSKKGKSWRVRIHTPEGRVNLGGFPTELLAKQAYDNKLKQIQDGGY